MVFRREGAHGEGAAEPARPGVSSYIWCVMQPLDGAATPARLLIAPALMAEGRVTPDATLEETTLALAVPGKLATP